MAHNEEGEFELVIGNRQLLLVFGVLLVLMGVLFTMGYLIGKNNPSGDAILAANRKQVPIDAGSGGSAPSANPIIVDPGKPVEDRPTRTASDLYDKATAPKSETKLPEVPVVPKVDEKSKEPERKKEEPKKDPPKPVEPKVVEKKPVEPAKVEPKVVASNGDAREPGSGTYLQVVAVDKKGADDWAGSLRNKSFNALVAPGPNATLFRVLIGPIKDKETLAQTKIDLEKIGVKGAIVKKY